MKLDIDGCLLFSEGAKSVPFTASSLTGVKEPQKAFLMRKQKIGQ